MTLGPGIYIHSSLPQREDGVRVPAVVSLPPLRLAPAPVRVEEEVPAPRRRRAGWALTSMLVGFPLWWVLGISSFIGHLCAVLMILELVRRRQLRVPRSFGFWILFLIWVIAGLLVLQVQAPGAVPSTSPGRYISWGYRFGWYFAGTVALVYIGNLRQELSLNRIARAGGWMFVTVAAGGWLAVIAPDLEFRSLLELILPSSLTNIEFVEFLVHPEVVQKYAEAATDTPRPSAPFSYSNIWGLNYACFLPFFMVSWLGRDGGWRRRVGPVILVLSLVPAISSLNRGMWAAVIAMGLFVAIRAAMLGRAKLLIGLVATVLVAGSVIAVSPLAEMISTRFDNPTSNDGRTTLAESTVQSVVEGSPLIGFGSTRDVQGSFYSIAGGSSPLCPLCTPPAMGTQGQVWLVIFSQGVVGLLFYLAFMLIWLFRGLQTPSGYATAGMAVIVAQIVTLPFYDSIGISTVALMMAVGVIWVEHDRAQEERAAARGDVPADSPTIAGFLGLLRRNVAIIVPMILLGGATGAAVQLAHGPTTIARISILLPEESTLANTGREATLDTLAQLARDREVIAAMAAAADHEIGQDDLYISADPNTRILNLRYAGRRSGDSMAAVEAAADTLLSLRLRLLDRERQDAVAQFDAQYTSLLKSVASVDASLAAIGVGDNVSRADAQVSLLEGRRAELLAQAGSAIGKASRASALPLDAGRVIRPASSTVNHDRLIVWASSGLFLGLLLGLLAGRAREAVGPRLRQGRRITEESGVPVLSRVPLNVISPSGSVLATQEDSWVSAVEAAAVHSPVTVMSADRRPSTARIASALEADLVDHRSHDRAQVNHFDADGSRVILVTSTGSRRRYLERDIARARRCGEHVVGVVLAESPTRSQTVRRWRTPRMYDTVPVRER